MLANPFTPVFGGKPGFFFGREDIIERFEAALADRGSDYRALFVTGSRGYGKTALLEHLSQKAASAGWTTVDVGPNNPIGSILRNIVPFDETTRTLDPSLDVSVLGSGGKLHVGSQTKTTRFSRDDFEFLFLRACQKPGARLFVSIDEAQKVPLDDIALISGAFQMASRKGYDVIIALAGLPYAYDSVIHHDGCTFMRRAAHRELGPLMPCDVRGAFEASFGSVHGLSVEADGLDELVRASKGHPYMMQLEGFYTIEQVRDRAGRGRGEKGAAVSRADALAVVDRARATYCQRALAPLVEEFTQAERDYLAAMARVLDERRVARTGDVARELGKTANQTSAVRRRLLDEGIVVAPNRGELMFFIPYLADYVLEGARSAPDGLDALMAWQI